MKKKRPYLILTAVLAVLICGYVGLKFYNDQAAKKESAAEEAAKIYLTQYDGLKKLSYSNGTDTIDFVQADTDDWQYQEDTELSLNQSSMTTMITTFKKLEASRKLTENTDSLADYGLEDPAYVINLTATDGKKKELLIGDAVSATSSSATTSTASSYYAKIAGADAIYLIDSAAVSALQFDLNQLVEIPTIPKLTTDNVLTITRTSAKETTLLEADTKDAAVTADTTEASTDSTAEKSSSDAAVDSEESTAEESTTPFEDGIEALSTAVLYTSVAYAPSKDDLATYGLDEDSRTTYTVVYTGDDDEQERFTFYIGKADSATSTNYVQLKGNKSVFQISTTVATNLKNAADAAS